MSIDSQVLDLHLRSAVTGIVRELIAGLRDGSICRASVSHSTDAVGAALAADLGRVVAEWQERTINELIDTSRFVFLSCADGLSLESLVTSDAANEPAVEQHTASRSLADSEPVEVPESLPEIVPTTNERPTLLGGLETGRSPTLGIRKLEAFLRRSGYVATASGNGDQVWKGPTGAVISLPRKRSDLGRGMQTKLLKQLSHQLGQEVSVFKGKVRFAGECSCGR